MPYRGATIPLPGLMAGYISGQPPGLLVKQFTVSNVLTNLLFRVTEAPTGGDLIIELNDLAAGTGDLLQCTIAAGATYGEVTGASVSMGALYQIVRSEGGTGTAMNLSGEYEMNSVTGVEDYFTTLANVKLDANISGTDANRDLVLNSMIAGVTRQMQDWMARDIVQGTTTEKLSGHALDAVYTTHYPILDITSLAESDSALVEDTDFESVDRDLELGQIIRLSGGYPTTWAKARRNIAITYDHGYLTVPDSLVTAATALVVAKFNETTQSGKSWRGLASKGVDPSASTTYDKKIWERETIPAMAPFRRLVS